MSLIPWRPFWGMDKWFEEEPRLWEDFEDSFPVIQPRMDIYKTDKNVVAEIELPGVNPEEINAQVEDSVLKIEADQKEEQKEDKKDYYRKEIRSTYYRRIIPLPVQVVDEKAEASYEDGMLKIVVPRKKGKEKKVKNLKIKIKNKKSKK
jgi:HSP20 family protein